MRKLEIGMAAVLFSIACGTSQGQIREVVVGITPTCPYGLSACWGGASEALTAMAGVRSVAKAPDAYNSTATVSLKGEGLPDVQRWRSEFKGKANEVYDFRGIEVTVDGQVASSGTRLEITVPGLHSPLPLSPLRG